MALLDGSLIALLEAVAAMARKGPGGHHGGGRRKSVLKGGNEEFADYRPYQPGDDFRRIDWKPWLRLGEAFTKVFARSTSGEVFVLLDTSASMGVPARKGLLAARLAAALGYLALCTGDRLTLEMLRQGSSAKLGPVEGKQNAGMLIATLEAARFGGACDLSAGIRGGSSVAASRPLVYLISDLFDEGAWASDLAALAGRGASVAVLQVIDEEELRPPQIGLVEMLDSETGERITRWVGAEAVAEYASHFSARQERIAAMLSAARAGHYPARTDLDPRDVLLEVVG